MAAILDLYSRKVLAFRVSNILATDFYIEALEEVLGGYGAPEILNTDQGSQFTADEFTAVLETKGVRISMDGKGRWIDNVFIERLPGSLVGVEVAVLVLRAPPQVKVALARYFGFYNARRPQCLRMLEGHEGGVSMSRSWMR